MLKPKIGFSLLIIMLTSHSKHITAAEAVKLEYIPMLNTNLGSTKDTSLSQRLIFTVNNLTRSSWGEVQANALMSNSDIHLPEDGHVGIGHRYYAANYISQIYYYYSEFFKPFYLKKRPEIHNIGLALTFSKLTIGCNGYMADLDPYGNNLPSSTVNKLRATSSITSLENDRIGFDGYVKLHHFKLIQPFFGIYHHRLNTHMPRSIDPYTPSRIEGLDNNDYNLSQSKNMTGIAFGFYYSGCEIKFSYDNLYGKRLSLRLSPFSFHYTIHRRRSRLTLFDNAPVTIIRELGPITPLYQEMSLNKLDITRWRAQVKTPAYINTIEKKQRIQLNQWASDTLKYNGPSDQAFRQVVSSSLVRLEKNSRIMLYQLANYPITKKKQNIPDEIMEQIAMDIVAKDVFKPYPLLDNAPISWERELIYGGASVIHYSTPPFPNLKKIPTLYKENPKKLRELTWALIDHYRALRKVNK